MITGALMWFLPKNPTDVLKYAPDVETKEIDGKEHFKIRVTSSFGHHKKFDEMVITFNYVNKDGTSNYAGSVERNARGFDFKDRAGTVL
jgi:hypothetical protein